MHRLWQNQFIFYFMPLSLLRIILTFVHIVICYLSVLFFQRAKHRPGSLNMNSIACEIWSVSHPNLGWTLALSAWSHWRHGHTDLGTGLFWGILDWRVLRPHESQASIMFMRLERMYTVISCTCSFSLSY